MATGHEHSLALTGHLLLTISYKIVGVNNMLTPLYLNPSVDGQIYVWGANHAGQLGLGHYKMIDRPELLPTASTLRFLEIAAGVDHSLAISGTLHHSHISCYYIYIIHPFLIFHSEF